MARKSPRTPKDRALDEIYAVMPAIPDCDGSCAEACGPIAMFKGEWDRIRRAKGHTPRVNPATPLTCPMLSPTGKCTVYTARPFICRLWGATPGMRCPRGCEPERWLTINEARDLFMRIREVAGPEVTGPLGNIEDLWAGIALDQREGRTALVDRIKEAVEDGRWEQATAGGAGRPASPTTQAGPGDSRASAEGTAGAGEPRESADQVHPPTVGDGA